VELWSERECVYADVVKIQLGDLKQETGNLFEDGLHLVAAEVLPQESGFAVDGERIVALDELYDNEGS
jgi:hypothetical protein